MAVAAHRARDRGASRDRRRLSESGRDRGAPPGAWGRRAPAKPANEVTTDSGADSKPANEVTTDSSLPDFTWQGKPGSADQPLRAVPRTDRTGAEPGPQCHGNLARPGVRYGFNGGYQSVKRFVRKLRGTAPPAAAGGDHDRTRRRVPKSITAPARWSAIRRPANTGAPDCSC